jgi:hypothetical protein
VFWVKMTLIALAMWTVTRIRARVFDDPQIDMHPVSADVKRLALASILLWAAAITAGRLLAYIGPTQPEAGIIFGSQ